MDQPTDIGLIGTWITCRIPLDGLPLLREQADAELCDHLPRDVGLHPEDVVRHSIVGLRPNLRIIGNLDELGRHAHATLLPPDSAFEDVVDAELFADLLGVLVRILVLVRTVS